MDDPFRFCDELGGIPLDEIGATGFGLAAAIDIAAEHIGLSLRDARVAIQGFGLSARDLVHLDRVPNGYKVIHVLASSRWPPNIRPPPTRR